MAKDKAFGFVILLFGLLLIVFYIFWAPVSLYYEHHTDTMSGLDWLYGIRGFNWEWAVVLPLTLGIICIGLLAAWIGYSMITTPPLVPLEELEEELEAEEAAAKAEEKAE